MRRAPFPSKKNFFFLISLSFSRPFFAINFIIAMHEKSNQPEALKNIETKFCIYSSQLPSDFSFFYLFNIFHMEDLSQLFLYLSFVWIFLNMFAHKDFIVTSIFFFLVFVFIFLNTFSWQRLTLLFFFNLHFCLHFSHFFKLSLSWTFFFIILLKLNEKFFILFFFKERRGNKEMYKPELNSTIPNRY